MARQDIINAVKARIDELTPFTDTELNPAISLIDKLLDGSALSVLKSAPLYLLTPTVLPASPVPNGRIGTVVLPVDYLRLYSFKMTGWNINVVKTITTENPLYKLQKNPVTMGGISKPIVVITRDATGMKLIYYSLPDGTTHVVEEGLYIKSDVAENLPDDVLEILYWTCSYDVLAAMGDQKAAIAKEKLSEQLTLVKD